MSCKVILSMIFEDDETPTQLGVIPMSAVPRKGDILFAWGKELGSLDANDGEPIECVVDEIFWDDFDLDMVDEAPFLPTVVISPTGRNRPERRKMCTCDEPEPPLKILLRYENDDRNQPVYEEDPNFCDHCRGVIQESENSKLLAQGANLPK